MAALSGRHLVANISLLALFFVAPGFAQNAPPTGARPQLSPRDGQALVELGKLQTELAEFQMAQESYLAGIELLVEENGEYSPSLIEPYTELAHAYLLNQQPLEAITILEQAQHISQRTFGLLNIEQVRLLDEISRAYLLIGDTVEAQNRQRERLTLALRRFGEDDPRVIPFHNQLADYYDRSRMRVRAREQYEAILAIQRENFGDNDGRLLLPLSKLVRIDILLGDSASARRRLLRGLESNDNATPIQVGNALAALGDWELALRRTDSALEYYRDAYATLQAVDPVAAAEYFATPRFIDLRPPPSQVDWDGNRASHGWGSISVEFGISAEGRATDIAVVQTHPRDLMDSLYIQRLREASYRPRLIDGEPADTAAVSYTHQFRYFVEDQQP